ncbi:dTMP kinase [Acanthopleuribacter pedis]|uniref:Thymidylate kinase n=1 Tax=Acanthopleuribacter pedis TaxID=442870 RepID=A0A8J7U2V2_9BACT|nr:dTMP kinase [Acanthopleuribacter pedis]MBO1318962.1 dTMP kinase [Acanthopleuribacter pedis]
MNEQTTTHHQFQPLSETGERGVFISFEGIEGCGKSTQSDWLSRFLTEHRIPTIRTKEPGATAIGAEIRKILLHADHVGMSPICEALLYLADRAQHHDEVIQPALSTGTWVVCDRYHDSTLAYQGAARKVSSQDLNRLFELATGALQPDLTLLLDLDVQTGLSRAQQRNREHQSQVTEGRFEAEAEPFHQAVRQAFLGMAAEQPHRFVVVDAARPVDEIAADIRGIVTHRFANFF